MGTTITIEDVDPVTLGRLKAEAARRGVAVGAVAGEALRRGLPLLPVGYSGGSEAEHDDLTALAGTWSAADAAAFAAATAEFGRVDPRLWG